MQTSSADPLPPLPSTSPSTSTPPLTTWPTPTPRRGARLLPSSTDPSTPARRDAAARAAKALLHSTIRDDWTWPSPPPAPTPTPLQWREREPNSSSPSPEPHDAAAPDPYKYETPDALAGVASTRKRKRRGRVLEEMRWNEGLRTYMARRDAWTGGVMRSSPPPAPPPAPTSISPSFTTTIPTPDFLEYVPLPPPLLPASNPIRASISPATYPSIYTKVVTQGLTPTIPINLADVTRAMVQGWKADGEWPSLSNVAVEAPVAKRAGKRRGLMEGLNLRGVGRVKRVLGLGGEEGEGG